MISLLKKHIGNNNNNPNSPEYCSRDIHSYDNPYHNPNNPDNSNDIIIEETYW